MRKSAKHNRFFRISVIIGLAGLASMVGIAACGYIWYRQWHFGITCDVASRQWSLRKEAAGNGGESDTKEQKPKLYTPPPFGLEQWRRVIRAESRALRTKRAAADPSINAALVSLPNDDAIDRKRNTFWSFRRLQPVEPPHVRNDEWVRNEIDCFILSRMEQAGVQPNPEADRWVLGRRLWFDLIGIPPTAEQMKAFLSDGSPSAYQQLVEKLLSDRGFGERWASPWLDLARYADSNGYEEDEWRPYAFTYRDFVIWAMNEDLPFDTFVRWQIAGDELAPHNPLAVAATGFVTGAPYNTFLPQESERHDELDDQVSTLSRAMLGLTVGCARCHDHMYDPISMEEYYRLVAVFRETRRKHRYLVPDSGKPYRVFADPVNQRRDEIKEMLLAGIKEDNIASLDFTEAEKDLLRQPIDPNNAEQARLLAACMRCLMVDETFIDDETEPLPKDRARYEQLRAELDELEPLLPPMPPKGLTLAGSGVAETHILRRGNWREKGKRVGPGFLTALTSGPINWEDDAWKNWARGDCQPRPRSALANWMTDVEQGAGALVARVVVNRLWQHHFGEGLVRTPSDFGAEGDRPTHPDLLEWLAQELVSNDWSLKQIHRLIVNSATYRQSSFCTPVKLEEDPNNELFSRCRPQRLSAEMLRDAMLAAAGELNREMYGPATIPPIPRAAIYNTQHSPEYTWPADEPDSPKLDRRSIYLVIRRTIPIPLMRLFDAPDGSYSCAQRKTTTVPTQALALWNSEFTRVQAVRLAKRLEAEWGKRPSREPVIHELFMATVSRPPTGAEVSQAIAFLNDVKSAGADCCDTDALTELCHVMFLTNEFLYLD